MTSSIASSSWLKATQILTNMHTPTSQQIKEERQSVVFLLDFPLSLLTLKKTIHFWGYFYFFSLHLSNIFLPIYVKIYVFRAGDTLPAGLPPTVFFNQQQIFQPLICLFFGLPNIPENIAINLFVQQSLTHHVFIWWAILFDITGNKNWLQFKGEQQYLKFWNLN